MKKIEFVGMLGLFALVFTICFLGFKSFLNPNIVEEKYYGDKEYVYHFDEKTIPNEKIVLFDNRGLDNIQYYVIKCSKEGYILYTYYYMGDKESYLNKYAEVVSNIVDYKYSEYMIKTLDGTGYDTYDELMNVINENNNFYIIY